jgi:hypothetical protein
LRCKREGQEQHAEVGERHFHRSLNFCVRQFRSRGADSAAGRLIGLRIKAHFGNSDQDSPLGRNNSTPGKPRNAQIGSAATPAGSSASRIQGSVSQVDETSSLVTNEAGCLVLVFGQLTKVARAFERMETGRKFVPASHAGKRVPLPSRVHRSSPTSATGGGE